SEVVLAVFFLLGVVYSLKQLQEKGTSLWFIIAILSGTLAVLSYTGSRFFLLIISAGFFCSSFLWKKKTEKIHYKGILVMLGMYLVVCIGYNMIGSIQRFSQIDIFHAPQTQLILDEQIREDQWTNPLITRIFHNKLINYSETIVQNYSEYFTLDYLFLHGG